MTTELIPSFLQGFQVFPGHWLPPPPPHPQCKSILKVVIVLLFFDSTQSKIKTI